MVWNENLAYVREQLSNPDSEPSIILLADKSEPASVTTFCLGVQPPTLSIAASGDAANIPGTSSATATTHCQDPAMQATEALRPTTPGDRAGM
jgi:hypothetical protein